MKFCLFISFAICLIFIGSVIPNQAKLETLGDGTHSFYSTEIISHPLITNTVNLGFSYIYECNTRDAGKLRTLFNRIDGESIKLDNNKSIKSILNKLDARVVNTQNLSGTKIVYAYTSKNAKHITDSGKKINVQIAQNDTHTIIGFPVILGAY